MWSGEFSPCGTSRDRARRGRPGSPSSVTRRTALWSLDLFRCESAILRTHWVLVVMDQCTRRIVGFGVQLGVVVASDYAQPMSFRTAVDLVAGAVDAWLNPQSSTAVTTTDAKGAEAMLPNMLQLRCGGYGPTVTSADNRKAAAVTIGGALALVIPLTWATARDGNDSYVFSYLFSFMTVSWLLPVTFSERYTSEGRPGRVQTVVIGGQAAILIAIALVAGWWQQLASLTTGLIT